MENCRWLDVYVTFCKFENLDYRNISKDLQDNAIESIFKDIKEAMNWESVPKSINIIQPDIPLYKNWIKILNQAIITKLENV